MSETDDKNSIFLELPLKQENICRLCLDNGGMLNVFDEISFLSMIEHYFNLEILVDDGLPSTICQNCMNILNLIEEFKRRCIENDKILKEGLSRIIKSEIYVKKEKKSDVESNDEYINDVLPVGSVNEYFNNDLPVIRSDDEYVSDDLLVVGSDDEYVNDDLSVSQDFNDSLYETLFSEKPKQLKKKLSENGFKKGDKLANKPVRKRKRVKKGVLPKYKKKNKLCPICGKTYKSLLEHIRTHSTEKPFTCDICLKCFHTKSKLPTHIATHSITRDFGCDLCGKKFKMKDTLRKHIKGIHERLQQVICEICGKINTSKHVLKKHMLVHSRIKNFECSFCNMKFSYIQSLRQHKRVHTGERPYPCRFCESKFSISRSRQEHERLHTGETPYKCPTCSKGFAQLSNMKSHFKHNHKDLDFNKVYAGLRRQKYDE